MPTKFQLSSLHTIAITVYSRIETLEIMEPQINALS